MDGVASAFAVVSLAIQLVETGEKISKFLSSVRDAPNEVTKLYQTLDQLNSTLKQVSYLLEQQYMVLRLPGSPVFITNALETCEKRIKTLEDAIRKLKKPMDHQNRVQRSWATMRFVSKKEDILEMQSQLRDAEIGLQTAMLSNSWHLQMHQISLPSSGGLKATITEEASLAAPQDSVSRRESLPNLVYTSKDSSGIAIKETGLVWYNGMLGSVKVQSKSRSLNGPKSRKPKFKVVTDEQIITVTPTFSRKTFELRVLNSFGGISRSLSTYPVLSSEAPIFDICTRGDLLGLQVALSSRGVSPFVLDQYGWSLLHHAVFHHHAEICALLLQLGVDPSRKDSGGLQALASPMWVAWTEDEASKFEVGYDPNGLECMRLLIQNQNEISLSDVNMFWGTYNGAMEGAKFMYSQGFVPSEFTLSNDEHPYPVLATALRGFGAYPQEWGIFIRHLLRKRVELSSPVPGPWGPRFNSDYGLRYPCSIMEYGTPLDELFGYTKIPFEGKAAADGWLDILSSEGYNIESYLEEEQALHAVHMHFTVSSNRYVMLRPWDETPRQLLFNWESGPSVSWHWWIDPDSSTSLVREEFKYLLNADDPLIWWEGWKYSWPYRHPAWSQVLFDQDNELHERAHERAQERANRRMKKKSMKSARAQGFGKREKMPGAWPV